MSSDLPPPSIPRDQVPRLLLAIEDLDLAVRTTSHLRRHGFTHVWQLGLVSPAELVAWRVFPWKFARCPRMWLEDLHLPPEFSFDEDGLRWLEGVTGAPRPTKERAQAVQRGS